ncbi:MAG: hypothetical protein J0I21_11150 [Alphaproteobacteria bacterium]|nr:hypothetical protein [Alphaproteobacteria bacterium]
MVLLSGRDFCHALPAMLQPLRHPRILIATSVVFALNAFLDGMNTTAHETANAVLASAHM